MYELILISLIVSNIYFIRDNKNIIIKSYLTIGIKISLIISFLIFVIITKEYAPNKIAMLFPLLIFILFYNTVIGGFKNDGIVVFWPGGGFPIRKKILYKDIKKINYKIKKDCIELSISAYSSYYNQYFSLDDKEKILKTLQRNKIKIEKKK
ncbi:MAG: hypothetical protein ACTIH2_00895 [Anaerococcus sp.]